MDGLAQSSAAVAEARLLRRLSLVGLTVLAWLVYFVGLIAPLTPSEGMPGVMELLIFALGPVALLLLVALRVNSVIGKILVLMQAAVIAGFTAWLLSIQAGTS